MAKRSTFPIPLRGLGAKYRSLQKAEWPEPRCQIPSIDQHTMIDSSSDTTQSIQRRAEQPPGLHMTQFIHIPPDAIIGGDYMRLDTRQIYASTPSAIQREFRAGPNRGGDRHSAPRSSGREDLAYQFDGFPRSREREKTPVPWNESSKSVVEARGVAV